jgi:3-oxoacyl-[acyl-carrier protein] reductase
MGKAGELRSGLSRPEGPTELFGLVHEALGPIQILVNNAAHSTVAPIEQLSADVLDHHHSVDLRAAPLLCC